MTYKVGDTLTCKENIVDDGTEYCTKNKSYEIVNIRDDRIYTISTNFDNVEMSFHVSGLKFWFRIDNSVINFDHAMEIL